ncbi:MAG: four helix bundle protein [Candidatus Yanofskybacteria bacterium]|nr:four helix bundle protein [Candidatus Yanofskybacteria bacterium]
MYYRFENLEIWKLAKKFSADIYKITGKFPKSELFGLTSQLRRAAVSIALNIAEGSDKKSDPEFKRFLRISLGSLNETVTGLYISLDLNFIVKSEFDGFYKDSCLLASKIKSLISSLRL